MTRQRLLAAAALVALGAHAAAQDYSPTGLFGESHADFFAKMDRYRPAVRASFLGEFGAGLDGEPGEFDMKRYLLEGRVPIVLDPDSVMLIGGRGEARRYDFSPNMGGLQNETLGGVGLDLGYGRFLSEDAYIYGVFMPGIYSDFDGTLHHEDWQFFGESVLAFRYSDNLFLKGGVRVSQDFKDLPVFPLLGLAWLINEAWRFDLLAPKQAELSWTPDPAFSLNAGIELEGQEYHVRAPLSLGGARSDWQVQELRLYVGGLYRFSDNLSAWGRVGAAIAGDNDFVNPAGVHIEGQLDPTMLFEVGLGWDF